MSSKITIEEHVRQACVAMNNIGVSLLERSCDKKAAETFQDTLTLIRASLSEDQAIHAANDYLEKAHQRLASSIHWNKTNTNSRVRTAFLEELCTDNNRLIRIIQNSSGADSAIGVAIRLDDTIVEESIESIIRETDLVTTVVLMNFGVAYSTCARRVQNLLRKKHCLSTSTQLLSLAFDHLLDLSVSEHDEFQLKKTLLLSVISLQNLTITDGIIGTPRHKLSSRKIKSEAMQYLCDELEYIDVPFRKSCVAAAA